MAHTPKKKKEHIGRCFLNTIKGTKLKFMINSCGLPKPCNSVFILMKGMLLDFKSLSAVTVIYQDPTCDWCIYFEKNKVVRPLSQKSLKKKFMERRFFMSQSKNVPFRPPSKSPSLDLPPNPQALGASKVHLWLEKDWNAIWCRIWSNDPIRIRSSELSENWNCVWASSRPWATVPADLSHVWTGKETLQRLGY